MAIMIHAKFHFNWLMLTLIFGIWASEPPQAWRTTEKAGPDRVKSSCRLAQLFLVISAVILREKREIVGENFFPSSENAIWPILLKYQEIDVQIQTFTNEN